MKSSANIGSRSPRPSATQPAATSVDAALAQARRNADHNLVAVRLSTPLRRQGSTRKSRLNVGFADESQTQQSPHRNHHRTPNSTRRSKRPLAIELPFYKNDSPDVVKRTRLMMTPNIGGQSQNGIAQHQQHLRPVAVATQPHQYQGQQSSSPKGLVPSHHTNAAALEMEKDMFAKRFNRSKSTARQRHDIYDVNEAMLNMTAAIKPKYLAATDRGRRMLTNAARIQQGERINQEMAFQVAAKRGASPKSPSSRRRKRGGANNSIGGVNNKASGQHSHNNRAAAAAQDLESPTTRWHKTGPSGAQYYVQASGRRQYYSNHKSRA